MAFDLINRGCVSSSYEYMMKIVYVGISSFSISCSLLILVRMWWRHHRKKFATAIGRLVERLVVIGAFLDVTFHAVDVLFALDCSAPPLLFLLSAYKENIHAAVGRGLRGRRSPAFLLHESCACLSSYCITCPFPVPLQIRRPLPSTSSKKDLDCCL